MANPIANMREGLLYKGREGQWSWLVHRLSGLGTLLFLVGHVLDTSTVYFWPEHYMTFINLYRNPFFGLMEMLLVAAVLLHGLNGLRIIVFDLKPELWTIDQQRRATWYVAGAFVVLYIPVVFFMGSNILQHLAGG